MTWSDVYLFCFAAGFLFSLVGILGGGAHFHVHGHHVPAGGQHVGASHSVSGRAVMSPFNPVTMAAFLAWFGGVGFLLTRYSSLWVVPALAIAAASGVVGAGALFLFLTRVLVSADENLDPADSARSRATFAKAARARSSTHKAERAVPAALGVTPARPSPKRPMSSSPATNTVSRTSVAGPSWPAIDRKAGPCCLVLPSKSGSLRA